MRIFDGAAMVADKAGANILPVSIDDTDGGQALVPEKFKSVHCTRLVGGTVTPEFAQRLRDFTQRTL